MTGVPSNFARIEPEAAREYLLTIAAALQDIASPEFRGDAARIAAKCSLTLVRIAQQVVPLNADFLAIMAARPGPAGEGEVLDALEQERSRLLEFVRTVKDRSEFDAAGFEAYLRGHELFGDSTRLRGATVLAGGRAKRTVLLELDGQSDGSKDIVLRQDLPSVFPRTSVSFEYPLLNAVWDSGLKVPRPILMEPADGPLGGPFILVQKLPGRTLGDLLSPPRSEGLALQLAELLGKLHALPAESFARLPDLGTKEHSQAQLRESLAWYRDLYERFDAPSETIASVFSWLDRTAAAVDGPLALIHGDVGFHNILVHDGVMTGLLDWEIAHLGNPAEDVGYCRGDIEMMTDWSRFLKVYREAGGPAFSDIALDFYALFGELKVYCSAVMTRASVATGKIRDLGITECIIDWTPILRHRLSRRLRVILCDS